MWYCLLESGIPGLPLHIEQLNFCASGQRMVLGTVLLPPSSYGRDQDTFLCCLCSEASETVGPNLTGMVYGSEVVVWGREDNHSQSSMNGDFKKLILSVIFMLGQ